MLACEDSTDYRYKYIFWCAIALGALVQGRHSEFVSYPLFNTRADSAVVWCGVVWCGARLLLVLCKHWHAISAPNHIHSVSLWTFLLLQLAQVAHGMSGDIFRQLQRR